MKKLTDEIKSMSRIVILFIDEIHMIEQAKGAEGAMNVSDILKPALSRGELQAIGATTWKEYEAYIKPDDALNRRFQPVTIGEPSIDATLQILRGIKSLYEEHHGVMYDDDALKAAVELSSKYIKERFLPDKAIDLLDESGAKVSIEASHNTKHAKAILQDAGVNVKKQLSALQSDKRELMEEFGHIKRIGEKFKDPELTVVQDKIQHLIGEIDKVDKRIKEQKLGKTPRVRVADIKEIVVSWTGKKIKK
jgi:ATP-dependent Clp protease ATP-binding subunit ClpA